MQDLSMVDYSQFKCRFCDCCKTKADAKCRLGWSNAAHVRDCCDFINWEAAMDTKEAPEHDMPRCDSVYIRDNNETVYFIEQKNIRWLLDNVEKGTLKKVENVAAELDAKFTKSKDIFEGDEHPVKYFKFIFSYDMDNVSNSEELERLFRNHFFTPLESFGIISANCQDAFDKIVYWD